MSTQAMKWAWDVADIALDNASALTVLLALAEHADPAGRCWPKVKTIARMAKCSEGTVKRRLTEFEEAGMLAVFERFDSKNGRQTSNEYRLAVRRDPASFAPPSAPAPAVDEDEMDPDLGPGPEEGEGSKLNPPEGLTVSPGEGLTMVSPGGIHQMSPLEPILEPIPPLPPAVPGGGRPSFEDFATAHGHPDAFRDGRARALFALLSDTEAQKAVEAAGQYARNCAAKSTRPCHAQHFIRSRMFEDPNLKPKPPEVRFFVAEGTAAFEAWRAVWHCLSARSIFTFTLGGQRGFNAPTEHPPMIGAAALPAFWRGDTAAPGWVLVRRGTQNWGAWKHWLGELNKPSSWPSVPVYDAKLDGWFFPNPWPPRKDGTFAPVEEITAEEAKAREQDEAYLQHGGSL